MRHIDRINYLKPPYNHKGYRFKVPRVKKDEIIDYFRHHRHHSDRMEDPPRLAWSCKIFNCDMNLSHIDNKWNSRWRSHVKEDYNSELFWIMCERVREALECDIEALFSDYEVELAQEGRSGGWLVLRRFKGIDMSYIENIISFPYDLMFSIYRFCKWMDLVDFDKMFMNELEAYRRYEEEFWESQLREKKIELLNRRRERLNRRLRFIHTKMEALY